MKRVSAVAVLSASILSGAAAAQEVEGDGAYFRVAAGFNFASDLDQTITYNPNLAFTGLEPTSQLLSVGEGLTAAAALGFDYTDGIRTELEYRYAYADIDSITASGPAPDVVTMPGEQLRAHLIMSNFYFDFTNDSPFTPFIGGGVGGAFVTNENGDTDAALALQGRAGISYDFGGGLFFSTEYVYLRSNELSYGPNDDDFTAAGPADPRFDGARYQTSSIMVSFRKKF